MMALTKVYVIVFENHDWSTIKGNTTSAPYINSILSRADTAYASNYHNILPTTKSLHPSEPNYIFMEAGTNCFSDMTTTGVSCTNPTTGFDTSDAAPSAGNATSSSAHLATLLTNSGKSWRAYQEDISGNNCPISSSGNYAARHNPFIFFKDISGNPPSSTNTTCQSHIRPFTQLATDLSSGTTAYYNFITPNLCHDMHSNSCAGSSDVIKQGDDWLSINLPTLLNSSEYQQGHSAIFVTFDEGGSGNNPIPMIILSPQTKGNGYTNTIAYSHASFVKSIQEIFSLSPLLAQAADPSTTDLSDLFGNITTTPTPAPNSLSLEAESGTLSGNTTTATDSGASGGSYVQINTRTTSISGEAMPLGDLPGWHQIFADDFPTDVPLGGFSGCSSSTQKCSGLPASVASKWGAYPDGWKDTSSNGTYYPSKVISIQNGVMDLYIHTENGIHMVSAPRPLLTATPSYGTSSGRFVIRWRSPTIPGYKTAWLLWPDSGNWPNDGEIDFPEGNLNGVDTIHGFMHKQNASTGSDQYAINTGVIEANNQWHTTVIEWLSGSSCKFYVDGILIGSTTDRVPNTSMHWVIQTETQLSGGAPADSISGDVQIDWTTAYVPQ